MSERTIFLAALEREDPAERAAYLDAACAGDPALRRQVESLLQAHAAVGASQFLNEPVHGFAQPHSTPGWQLESVRFLRVDKVVGVAPVGRRCLGPPL